MRADDGQAGHHGLAACPCICRRGLARGGGCTDCGRGASLLPLAMHGAGVVFIIYTAASVPRPSEREVRRNTRACLRMLH